ncbi:MAG: hypothetical protein GFH27_549303n180 [Chloroflexi bacterium AL-W]|nr:hypothetical protein [Chloroflexi bacterium AL-N1]NOK68065.1 hypothetical protein [Chloroflexi bacterium AL-N10]NOK73405.1 hypothetical protein [Chloroflexi bacterium AL-N5]NOK83319.1 hypothetical protein [Chloroflexi bacterium AL-W]NOK87736.1 hypothetical protein [Chloroflexi bacterium AL-N15]
MRMKPFVHLGEEANAHMEVTRAYIFEVEVGFEEENLVDDVSYIKYVEYSVVMFKSITINLD